jgi:hypothetical protein
VEDGAPRRVPRLIVQQAPQPLAHLGGAGMVVVEHLRDGAPT